MHGGKFAKKNKKIVFGLLAVAVVLILAVTVIMLNPDLAYTLGLRESDADSQGEINTDSRGEINEDILLDISEQDDTMVVSTTYGNFNYPFAYSDLLQVVPIDNDGQISLEFYGRLEYGEYLVYTLWLGQQKGNYVGIVMDENGNKVDVYLELEEKPKELKKSDEDSFYAAQETVNSVLESFLTPF